MAPYSIELVCVYCMGVCVSSHCFVLEHSVAHVFIYFLINQFSLVVSTKATVSSS